MDNASRRVERSLPTVITVPGRTLLVLCGSAGCGKSSFARRLAMSKNLKTTTTVSSDECRALICDEETNQQVSRDAFDLFHYIIHKRMLLNRFTIADSTALQADARQRLLEVAQRHSYHTCILVFNFSTQTCLEHDRQRQRIVGEPVIVYQQTLLLQALSDIPHEGWQQVHILQEQDILKVKVEIVGN